MIFAKTIHALPAGKSYSTYGDWGAARSPILTKARVPAEGTICTLRREAFLPLTGASSSVLRIFLTVSSAFRLRLPLPTRAFPGEAMKRVVFLASLGFALSMAGCGGGQ